MTYVSEVLADSPIVYLKMDEASGTVATDSGSNAVNGTYTNGPVVNTTAGGINGGLGPCVTFDGSNDHVLIADSAPLRITGDLTLEMWIYPTGFGSFLMLWTKSASGTGEFELMITPAGYISFRNGNGTDLLSDSKPRLNQWNHVAFTRSGLVVTHWLNGRFNGAYTLGSLGSSTGTQPVCFGRRSDGFYFLGRAMHAAIYTTVLTQARLRAHLDALTTGPMRATQAAAEVAYLPDAALRVTQLATEVAYVPTATLRVSQLAIEVLYAETVASGGARSQIVVAG